MMFMNNYWDKVWWGAETRDYKKYINLNQEIDFIKVFRENNARHICDAACGFGKYSAILSSGGFDVSGFDVSEESVKLTLGMLEDFNLAYRDYYTCSITDIKFQDDYFDGVVAHAVIDHMPSADAVKALNELLRITKKDGLIYVSFDGMEDEDLHAEHIVMEDGSFQYTEGSRNGMIFKHYSEKEIEKLLEGKSLVYYNVKPSGEREVMLRKI